MARKTDKLVVYHIPKCGGIFVKEAMRRAGVHHRHCMSVGLNGRRHPFNLVREHSTPDTTWQVEGLFSFCFIRYPTNWYRSFWAYRRRTEVIDPRFPADQCWDDEIIPFVNNVIDEHGGFVTKLYQYFIGENCDKVDFIGKQENLREDLITALTLSGEDFNPEKIRTTKYFNRAASKKEFRKLIGLDRKTRKRILKAEKWVIKRFYND